MKCNKFVSALLLAVNAILVQSKGKLENWNNNLKIINIEFKKKNKIK